MAKVKVRQIKKAVGDGNINNMFEEMMGIKDADPEIIVPKFVKARNVVRHICKVLNQFATFGPLRTDFPIVADGLDDILALSDTIISDVCIKMDTEDSESNYIQVSKEDINNLYRKLKENPSVKKLIIMCNGLDKYKANFANQQENFVNQEPGLSFRIFEFSRLDLKMLWAENRITSMIKKYILSVLASLHKHSRALYEIITSPDVDIEKFTELLLSSIAELKKQPKLSRCHAAFKRIEQSIELLKDKFGDYYRESLASQNPDSLVTSFIVDVSNQGGADARLTREFRQIIQYMHEMSQKNGKSKDPNVQKIFSMLNNNFELMEKHTKKKTGKAGNENPAESEEQLNDLLDKIELDEQSN